MHALRWAPPILVLVVLTASSPLSSTAAGTPRCGGRPATIVGTAGADSLTGTKQADVIVGRGGDDLISGLGGDDRICGGPGSDRLLGGAGDDALYGGTDKVGDGPGGSFLVGDVLAGGAGDDVLNGGVDDRKADSRRRPDSVSFADSPAGVVVDLSGTVGTAVGEGVDTIVLGDAHGVVGSAYADSITGSRGPDRVDGGAGPDTLSTGGGVDLVFPDGLDGQPGRDVVETGPGADLVSSLSGRDQISTGRGDDFVEAFSSEPTAVDLGPGKDYLGQNITPGSGADAQGGGGDDVVAFYGSLLAEEAPSARFTVDYRTGVTAASGSVAATGTIGGFEGHRFLGPLRWRFLGSELPERVWAIQGGPLRARTAGGADQLTGTPRDDLLDGGPGTDLGYGKGGDDDCRSVERGDC